MFRKITGQLLCHLLSQSRNQNALILSGTFTDLTHDIINLREYGETVYMDPMADRVGISYMTYDGSLYGGADNDVAVVDNPFDGVTTGEVDPDIEGPDYTNNANVEGQCE